MPSEQEKSLLNPKKEPQVQLEPRQAEPREIFPAQAEVTRDGLPPLAPPREVHPRRIKVTRVMANRIIH
jgi:hypothetical protein